CGSISDQLSRVVEEHADLVITKRVRDPIVVVVDPLGDPVDGHRLGRLTDVVGDLVSLHVASLEQRSQLSKQFSEMTI
ncbi:hypothetical protein PMAYCL1PPCAC_13881, partial [Pristionchus mayeri]